MTRINSPRLNQVELWSDLRDQPDQTLVKAIRSSSADKMDDGRILQRFPQNRSDSI